MAKNAEIKVKISADGGASAASEINKVEKAAGTAGTGLAGLAGHSSKLSGALGHELKGATEEAGGGFSALGAATGPVGIGIAAVAGFALEGVSKFENLGVAVGKFKDATGLSAEESSRWIQVAKDHGVEADALQSSIGKMEKALGKNADAFKQYGVETVRAKDGTVDANATFLGAVDALNGMEDPEKRAAAGAAIFGKGWQGMAELIGEGAPKLQADLKSVAPSEIFSDGDITSAKGVRDAFNEIKHAGEGLLLTVGKSLAPVISEIAPLFANVLSAVEPLAQAIGTTLGQALKAVAPLLKGLSEALGPIAKALGVVVGVVGDTFAAFTTFNVGIKASGAELDKATGIVEKYGATQQGLQQAIRDTGIDHESLTKIQSQYAGNVREQIIAVEKWIGTQAELQAQTAESARWQAKANDEMLRGAGSASTLDEAQIQATESERLGAQAAQELARQSQHAADVVRNDMAAAAGHAADEIDKLTGKWDELKGSVSDDQAFLNLEGTFNDVRDKAQAAWDGAKKGGNEARDSALAYKQSVDDLKQSIIDVGKNVAGISPEETKKLLMEVDSGQLDLVEQQIARIKANAAINVSIVAKGGAGYGPNGAPRASGGPVTAGTQYTVGEHGVEQFVPSTDGTIIPNNQLGGSGGPVHVTINMPVGSSGEDVVRAIKTYERRNGTGWRS